MINYSIANPTLQPAIEQEIEKLYNHEIKVKRVKKELAGLNHLHVDNTNIEAVRFSSVGIRIPIRLERRNRVWLFELRLDGEYPFGHPQLHSLDKGNGSIAEAKDLLSVLLENQNWGPSYMLSKFVEELPLLAQKIQEARGKPLGRYWQGEEYDRAELGEKGLTLFKVTEDTWRFMMKSTNEKVLAVSPNVILKLQQTEQSAPNRLKLEASIFMKDIIEIVSNEKSRAMTIKHRKNQREEIIYLNVAAEQTVELLSMINPVQMIERRVKECEDKGQVNEQLINDYGVLIEHYSVKDEAKSNGFLVKMRQAIKMSYKPELKE